MMVVCKDRLDSIRQKDAPGAEAAAAVEGDINTLLSGKTYDQLLSLQRQVQEKLNSGEPIDPDYWESLLRKLLVWKAKVRCYYIYHLRCSDQIL
jgi:hypothetical protein